MQIPWNEESTRRRVRLVDAELTRDPDMHTEAEITLEWEAVEYRGRATAVGHGTIDLRVCAQATLHALEDLLDGRMQFRLIGVKSVKAFDDTVAVVAVGIHDPETGEDRRLIGTCQASDGDLAQGVARAVLNATNRVLGNFLATRD